MMGDAMTAIGIERVRFFALLGVGGVLLIYAALALAFGDPQAFSGWVPGAAGFGAAALITLAAVLAGNRAAEMATDEGYRADRQRAESWAFWIALLLYPGFAPLVAFDLVSFPVAFAAMGALTGAAFLLLFCWFDLRGRQ